MKPPFIIAEIGVNYYDLALKLKLPLIESAKLMIKKAYISGVNAVKFQAYKSEKLAAPHSPSYWSLDEESTESQIELFRKYDKFNEENYIELAGYCKKLGIGFMSTAFDLDSFNFIDKLVKTHKIASADITNVELLENIGITGKPVFLSVGASNLEEISQAIKILNESGSEKITLMHCVLNYPTRYTEAKLCKISSLKKHFPNFKIGYSDHTKFDVDLLTTSWLLGAKVIEKHFTLDKSIRGNDHYHSADHNDMAELIEKVNRTNTIIGIEDNSFFNSSEIAARHKARRGVYLTRDVEKGEIMVDSDVEFLRPQLDGISPIEWRHLIDKGNFYRKRMKKGDLIKQ